MRLINAATYELEEHLHPPPYAILSHTWRNGQEVLYSEFATPSKVDKSGYRKIEYLCKQAHKDGLDYAWIDTACIDKSSSAELSEAINSMFMWYQEARVCYVFLDDISDGNSISGSRWITRGWTLQELIAPQHVKFYDRSWNFLGTKLSLIANLVRWTRIDQVVLEDSHSLRNISAATKMLWASSRSTNRIEDMAYCLLGIFDVNMSLIYGEREKAFRRLQEEILRQHHDLSILAFERDSFRGHEYKDDGYQFFAPNPSVFGLAPKVINTGKNYGTWTNIGLEVSIPLHFPDPNSPRCNGVLPCRYQFNLDEFITIPLTVREDSVGGMQCFSINSEPLGHASCPLKDADYRRVLLLQDTTRSYGTYPDHIERPRICCLRASDLMIHGYKVIYAEPETGIDSWDGVRLVSEVATHSSNILIRKFGFVCPAHHDAFIVMLTNVHWTYRTDKIFLSAKVKPRGADCTKWLAGEGMYKTLRQPGDNTTLWYEEIKDDEETFEINGVIWEQAIDSPLELKLQKYKNLHLTSDKCFRSIDLRLEKLGPTSQILALVLEPKY